MEIEHDTARMHELGGTLCPSVLELMWKHWATKQLHNPVREQDRAFEADIRRLPCSKADVDFC